MTHLVVDASVAVKWFVAEEDSIKAVRLLETAASLAAPDLISAEIANTLWKKVRRGEMDSSDASEILAAFSVIGIRKIPVATVLPSAFEFAVGLDRTVYDSLYLASAIALDRTLITADRKFAAAVAASPFCERIRLL